MDDGERSAPKIRIRTESNGGSSDSELSEGWNIIDQTDVTNHDVPSSDGESVEVIEAEDESRGNVTDTEVEGEIQLSPPLDTPVTYTDSEVLTNPRGAPREEMFDSSFRWFLIYATAAVLVSNLAFMIAENALVWNADVSKDAPSFLRDLPTTPKLVDENYKKIHWADKEEVMVETLEHRIVNRHLGSKNGERPQSHEINKIKLYKPSVERIEKHGSERLNKQLNKKYSKEQNEKFTKNINENSYKHPDKKTEKYSYHDIMKNHEIGRRYVKTLSEIPMSPETKDKFNQVLLILDALYIGLNELEHVVTKNSKLQDVLKKQQNKLTEVLAEMEYGVSKSLDRVATNTLNKVLKLERRVEHQWCELEKQGHQKELKGLFYDCQENEGKTEIQHNTDPKNFEEIKTPKEIPVMEATKVDMKWNSYQYQVDKDSPGKEHSNTQRNEVKEVDAYYMLVKKEMQSNFEISKESENTQPNSNQRDFFPSEEDNKSKYTEVNREILDNQNTKRKYFDDSKEQTYDRDKNYDNSKHDDEQKHFGPKEKHYNDDKKRYNDKRNYKEKKKQYEDRGKLNGGKEKYYSEEGKHYKDNRRHHDDKIKHTNDKSNDEKTFSDSKRKHDDKTKFSEHTRTHTKRFDSYKSKEQHSNLDQTNDKEGKTKSEKSVPNLEPELIRKYLKESCEKGRNKFNNMYEKLKNFIDSKLRVPKKMFDSLFAKYCQVNDDSFKWEKRFNREHPKGDFSGKNNFLKDEFVINNSVNKYVRIVDTSEIRPEDEAADTASDNIIIPKHRPRQWVFSYDEPLHDNQSNLTGEWFFKAGESRSKMRWSHHRGDWWFERASHRRNQPRPSHWFSGKRKNWYFRRAYARQNCRNSPHDRSCDFSEEETVTVPNASMNLR